ncbi:MAG TPA: HAD family hydrolase [Acidimicrobiales bacterium]
MSALDAVLFDFGHTLFDNADATARAAALATESGQPFDAQAFGLTYAAVRERSRTPEELAKGRDLSAALHRSCWLALLAPFDELVPGLAEVLYGFESGVHGWVPYPDSAATLDALAGAGLRIGVVSDTGWDLRPLFAMHGLDRHIESWMFSFEHGAAKPAPRLFETACAELGVDPRRTLMVGDSYLTDGGAADAGLLALVLPGVPNGAFRGLDAVLRVAGVA